MPWNLSVELSSLTASSVFPSQKDTEISDSSINSANDKMEHYDGNKSMFAMTRMSDVPCGKTLEGNELKPINVYKFVTVAKSNGRSKITFLVSKPLFLFLNVYTNCYTSLMNHMLLNLLYFIYFNRHRILRVELIIVLSPNQITCCAQLL